MDQRIASQTASKKSQAADLPLAAVGRSVQPDAAGRRRWRPRPTVSIWGRDHLSPLTLKVRPRPAHDLSRDQLTTPPCADCTFDPGGAGAYRFGTTVLEAGGGCGSHKWPL